MKMTFEDKNSGVHIIPDDLLVRSKSINIFAIIYVHYTL